jgi:hypothetical protein
MKLMGVKMPLFDDWSDFKKVISYWDLPKDIMERVLEIESFNHKDEDKIAVCLRTINRYFYLTKVEISNSYLKDKIKETRDMIAYYEAN